MLLNYITSITKRKRVLRKYSDVTFEKLVASEGIPRQMKFISISIMYKYWHLSNESKRTKCILERAIFVCDVDSCRLCVKIS